MCEWRHFTWYFESKTDISGSRVTLFWASAYKHIGAHVPGRNRGLEYLYICGPLPPEGRRCWWAEQEETGSGERWRGKRESLRRVRALMAPLTTSSVMVSLSLWVLWNCRPALYSWGLRGDKRPFNSERREVTEREALREGYQSDIHHTNLSLGTGPAKEGPWRWSWACVCGSVCACARLWGWGDTACTEWRLQGGRRRGEGRRGEAPRCSGVRAVTVQSGGEVGVALWSSHLFQMYISVRASFTASFQLKLRSNQHKWPGRRC